MNRGTGLQTLLSCGAPPDSILITRLPDIRGPQGYHVIKVPRMIGITGMIETRSDRSIGLRCMGNHDVSNIYRRTALCNDTPAPGMLAVGLGGLYPLTGVYGFLFQRAQTKISILRYLAGYLKASNQIPCLLHIIYSTSNSHIGGRHYATREDHHQTKSYLP